MARRKKRSSFRAGLPWMRKKGRMYVTRDKYGRIKKVRFRKR